MITDDDYNNDDFNDDDIPDRVAADNDDHNVDANSGDQNLSLSDQFLQERIRFCIKSGFTGTIFFQGKLLFLISMIFFTSLLKKYELEIIFLAKSGSAQT